MTSRLEKQIQKRLMWYERGIVCWGVVRDDVASFAGDPEFFNYLHLMPDKLISDLKTMAKAPFAHPEDVFFEGQFEYSQDKNSEAKNKERTEQNLRTYWSHRKLKEYFYPDLPMPRFQQRRMLGVLKEVIFWEEQLVSFGIFSQFHMNNNPTFLILPDGTKWIPETCRMGRLKRDGNQHSKDRRVKHLGQQCIFLGSELKSPDELPTGTEVWVDRSGVKEIPPPPKLFEE